MINIAYIVFAVLFFMIQLVVCFKATKIIIRLAPDFLILLGYVIALLCAVGIFGSGGGFIDGGSLAGAIIAIAFAFATVGDLLAWCVWALIRKYRKSKD